MDKLIQKANRLIEKLLQLHPLRDKLEKDRLISQLWEILDSIETLEEKVYFLVSLNYCLNQIDTIQKNININNLRRRLRQRSLELISESGGVYSSPEDYLAQQVIQKLIQVDSRENKEEYYRLNSQLEKIVEFFETLEKKLGFLVRLGCTLSREETRVKENFLKRELVTRILQLIDQSGKLWHHPQEYSGEAWKRTLEYLYDNLERYDHERATVVTWVNNYYRWRGIDERNQANARDQHLIDIYYGNDDDNDDNKDILADIISIFCDPEETFKLLKKIRLWAKITWELGEGNQFLLKLIIYIIINANLPKDVDFSQDISLPKNQDLSQIEAIFLALKRISFALGLFKLYFQIKVIHIRNRPDINASKIILSRLEETEWQDLAQEFDVSVSTLSSFYERQCRPRLIEYVEFLGYERPDTPANPVQNIKLIFEKIEQIYQNLNIKTQVKEWVNTEEELTTIFWQNRKDLTANEFLNQLLDLLENQARLQTKTFADSLDITVTQAEKFYEYRIQPKLHNWLQNQGYNLREIYQ